MGTYRPFQPTLRHPQAKQRKRRATKPEGNLAQEAMLGYWPVQKVPLLMADTLFLRQHRGVPPAPTRSMVVLFAIFTKDPKISYSQPSEDQSISAVVCQQVCNGSLRFMWGFKAKQQERAT
ncbi:hypothetical protein Q7C36_006409 [Tachysurus vachellii]|uniref:Uncharacterized protein n=1 Tax=Tachysurus vachellii TaxID=175792 RepID=A0AA88T1F1_TACVA|nr:hypothetical protein Q7C36_006409 [Tachysurus vachellii]